MDYSGISRPDVVLGGGVAGGSYAEVPSGFEGRGGEEDPSLCEKNVGRKEVGFGVYSSLVLCFNL